jgi:molybdopterin converting factor small subunit
MKKGDEVHFQVIFRGWAGELLEADCPGGTCEVSAPQGIFLRDFFSQWLQGRPKAREYFWDADHKRFKAEVMVILNGKYQSPDEEVELREGDTLTILPVASGG